MSLLIKALDKAQEEAQAAKGKQKVKPSDAEQPKPLSADLSADLASDLSTNLSIDLSTAADSKRQPLALNAADDGQSLSLNSAASEKIAAANALELELSPKIKTDSGVKPAVQIKSRREISANVDQQHEMEPPKQTSAHTLGAASTSKAFTTSKNNHVVTSDMVTKTNAANVFAAKRIEANHQNTKIVFIAGVGLMVLLAIAAYFYQLADNESDLKFIAQRPAPPAPSVKLQTPLPAVVETEINREDSVELLAEPAATQNIAQTADAIDKKILNADTSINALRLAQNEAVLDVAETPNGSVKVFKEPMQTQSNLVEVEQIASKSASIQVSKTTEPPGVNPVLMRAYDAYNAGNDTDAIKLYKQVLQRDVRNVDALLGLGAIAQRQGRLQDANGWYGKVLELDPKNTIALGFSVMTSFNLTTTLDSQPQNDVNSESRIKSMLAKQPDDASLHAMLGNYYADSNQWPAAQQAYFDAYRLSASAENAFNLAISLDHLAKPKLALPYYQRALQLIQTTRSNIDKAALEARIAAIE